MDNADFMKYLSNKRQKKEESENKYKDDSKERLKKIATSKIKTTMIGALESIEKNFGFLWENNEKGVSNDEIIFFKDLYSKVRKSILDNGNHQIHTLEEELNSYDITWNRYTVNFNMDNKTGNLLLKKDGENNEG